LETTAYYSAPEPMSRCQLLAVRMPAGRTTRGEYLAALAERVGLLAAAEDDPKEAMAAVEQMFEDQQMIEQGCPRDDPMTWARCLILENREIQATITLYAMEWGQDPLRLRRVPKDLVSKVEAADLRLWGEMASYRPRDY
jgi:hypothetical protein